MQSVMEQHLIIIFGCLKFNFSSVKYTNYIAHKSGQKIIFDFFKIFFSFSNEYSYLCRPKNKWFIDANN